MIDKTRGYDLHILQGHLWGGSIQVPKIEKAGVSEGKARDNQAKKSRYALDNMPDDTKLGKGNRLFKS
jgi:hypothetical protein